MFASLFCGARGVQAMSSNQHRFGTFIALEAAGWQLHHKGILCQSCWKYCARGARPQMTVALGFNANINEFEREKTHTPDTCTCLHKHDYSMFKLKHKACIQGVINLIDIIQQMCRIVSFPTQVNFLIAVLLWHQVSLLLCTMSTKGCDHFSALFSTIHICSNFQ